MESLVATVMCFGVFTVGLLARLALLSLALALISAPILVVAMGIEATRRTWISARAMPRWRVAATAHSA